MGEISASQSIDIAASADQVIGVLADYVDARPAILPEQYRDYKVISGGQGDGTVVFPDPDGPSMATMPDTISAASSSSWISSSGVMAVRPAPAAPTTPGRV